MKHRASREFRQLLDALPQPIQDLAAKNFSLLKQDSSHPSLHFKKVGSYYSVRIGLRYRALGVDGSEGVLWFWIGSHAEYDRLMS